jgi:hypothetical protein
MACFVPAPLIRNSTSMIAERLRGWVAHPSEQATSALSDLRPERHCVHDAARQEREKAGDHQRAAEEAHHCSAVVADIMPMCAPHRDWQHDQREDRQQVDRTERPPQLTR